MCRAQAKARARQHRIRRLRWHLIWGGFVVGIALAGLNALSSMDLFERTELESDLGLSGSASDLAADAQSMDGHASAYQHSANLKAHAQKALVYAAHASKAASRYASNVSGTSSLLSDVVGAL